MAIDDADQSGGGERSEGEASEDGAANGSGAADTEPSVRVGEYTWEEFMREYGYEDAASTLYPDDPAGDDQLGLETDEHTHSLPTGEDWDRVAFDPTTYLGYEPDELRSNVLATAGDNADELQDHFLEYVDPETTPVTKDVWTWEHYKWEYYYEDDGSRPRDSDGEIVRHDEADALGFDPDSLEDRLFAGDEAAMELRDLVEERTVNVQEEIDEDEFFSTAAGNTTVANRYDLEKAVPMAKKTHFREVERYWVNKPYAYVVIFHSEKENEKKYYLVEPYLNEIELDLQEFLTGKLRTAIKYSDDGVKQKANEDGRRVVIEDETRRLLKRYDLFEKQSGGTQESIVETVKKLFDDEDDDEEETASGPEPLEGLAVRPEPAILADDPDTLNEYQVEKLLYLLKRNFIGYERIDGIKHDINVEDISCDGYNSPVFVYHSEYEQIISNVYHGEDELDNFVVKLAQRSGKGISKRLPQVDATLPDGSRAQLTLGKEVSDHGTNYTIRQFKDVPFTPIDLINWNTFSLDEMAFLWLAIENHKSLIFAGGTASGKTTSLNAVSLFIPSNAKIVSIEDTREVELPQRNWIASVTRPSFSDDEQGDVDEFDLLEAALRQRPDYIVMGEIRGEEGRTLFQVMSTGHTTYTTFHADSVDEVLKRFTTDPINVSKTMFTALDLVSIQTQTRVQGRKVRRNKSLTEINHYEAEHDEINVQDVYQWQAETDEFLKMGDSNTLEEIQFDRGWSREKLEDELFKREVILAYLIKNGLNTYAEVAATVQAFINDPDTILTLIANGQLEDSLEDLREMESVLIDVDQEKEELVPRPEATTETYNLSTDILERAEESLFEEYRGKVPSGLASALGNIESEDDPIEVDDGESAGFDFATVDDGVDETGWEADDGASAVGADAGTDEPAWLSDDAGFEIGSDADTAEATTDDDPGDAAADGTETAEAATTAPVPVDEPTERPAESTPEALPAAESAESSPPIEDETEPVAAEDTSTADVTRPEAEETTDTADASIDDVAADDLGGLFEDMGETIDELEESAGSGSPVADEAAGPGEARLTDDESDSIFDPDTEDDPRAFADELADTDGDSEHDDGDDGAFLDETEMEFPDDGPPAAGPPDGDEDVDDGTDGRSDSRESPDEDAGDHDAGSGGDADPESIFDAGDADPVFDDESDESDESDEDVDDSLFDADTQEAPTDDSIFRNSAEDESQGSADDHPDDERDS